MAIVSFTLENLRAVALVVGGLADAWPRRVDSAGVSETCETPTPDDPAPETTVLLKQGEPEPRDAEDGDTPTRAS